MNSKFDKQKPHCVLFDGTSYYIGSINDLSEEVDLISKHKDIDEAQKEADKLNNELTNFEQFKKQQQ